MALIAGHAILMFGIVWALMCLLAAGLVTDELLRTQGTGASGTDASTRWRGPGR